MTTNTNADDVTSSNHPTTWREWKTRAAKQFQDGNYDAALYSYTQALRPDLNNNSNGSSSSSSSISISSSDRQILLSNIVACRLKIGGRTQAAAAVETAKQCIQLNPQWAKGHVRLASALIAMDDPTMSNDACRELQRALQLDPGNPTAREMLVKELRRDHRARYAASAASSSESSSAAATNRPPNPSAPPQYMDDQNFSQRNSDSSWPSSSSPATASSSTSNSQQRQQQHQEYGSTNGIRFQDVDIDIDETPTWRERFQFHVARAKTWYGTQSDDVKTLLKVMAVLVCLYVALGGRFGLEYIWGSPSTRSSRSRRVDDIYSRYHSNMNSGGRGATAGNYDKGNAYEEFYRNRYRRQTQESNHHERHHEDQWDDRRYDPYSNRRRGGGSSSYFYGGDTGGVPNMLILAGVTYLAHRMGISPFQAFFYANMVMNGGRGRPRRMFGPGFGGGVGGFGGLGGFGRAPRYGQHHRPGGGMWWG